MTGWLAEGGYLLAVILGGATGSALRYGLGRWLTEFEAVRHFPWHTFGINVVGSFVLGLVAVWYKAHPQPAWFLLLGTGFCGGFTTFSAFSLETLTLLEQDRPVAATGYAIGSVLAGLVAAWVAVKLARGEF
jgi:CrcB protein